MVYLSTVYRQLSTSSSSSATAVLVEDAKSRKELLKHNAFDTHAAEPCTPPCTSIMDTMCNVRRCTSRSTV